MKAPKQLSLFAPPEESHEIEAEIELPQNTTSYSDSELVSMQAWLLSWAERNGYPHIGFPIGKDRRWGGIREWKKDIYPPYGFIQPNELYPGEVLHAAIVQCKSFDSGEMMPWRYYNLGEKSKQSSEEEE